MTEQRRIVAQVLEDSQDHPDVEELYARALKLDPRRSIATVYRSVKLFEESGILEKLEFGDGRARYEDAERDHHDHLIDMNSGEVIEFIDPDIEALQEKLPSAWAIALKDIVWSYTACQLSAAKMSESIKRENLLGIGFITLAMAAFAVEDSLIKLLSTRLASGQILLMIGLGGTLGFFIWSRQKGEGVTAEMMRNPWVIGRTLSELVGTAFFVLSLALVPITTVSAIIQVSPLLVTLGAAVMLREKVGIRRWSAILVGLLGVAVILRPWSATFEASALLALMGVIGLSARDVATRRIAKSTPSLALATLGFGATIPAGLILLIFDLRLIVPTPTDSLLIVVSILIAIGGYYCIIAAMRIGEVSAVVPFRYSRLVFGVAIGVWYFGEVLDHWTLIGSAIVVLSGL